MRPGLVRIALRVPAAAADAFEAALAEVAATVSRFDDAGEPGFVRVEGLTLADPDPGELDCALALATASSGIAAPAARIEPVAERDWVAASRGSFPPFRLDRFLIRRNEDAGPAPAGTVALALDAGLAFGSGRHGSTAGCLLALGALRHRRVRRALDVGCGSGILAIAIAKLWRAPVVACDIDAQAIAVTRANAAANGVGREVCALVADGVRARVVRKTGRFDLVAANILAPPLRSMAGDIASVLTPCGRLVLSGFLAHEGEAVLAAYRTQGLPLVRRIVVDGWLTLILGR
ncbi:MAG TPA: 50S ribosomal protein L11 methyltransferase [Rhodospirillales bacterium]|nr:50S ribosomal protein L11 methyltransferase [Rhodospirillales bacterium]